jgi:hypothetical protein
MALWSLSGDNGSIVIQMGDKKMGKGKMYRAENKEAVYNT